MNPLVQLADKTWLSLQDLLKHFDNEEEEEQIFLNDTDKFFQERLLIYQKQRIELENELKILIEQMYQLSDDLNLPRITFDNQQLTLKEKKIFVFNKINEYQNLIVQRDKQIILLQQLISNKIKVLGNIQINIDQIRSTNEANAILSDLRNQLNKLKENIRKIFNNINSLNPEIYSKYEIIVKTFLSINDENELSWINKNCPLTGSALYSQLNNEYETLRANLLDEVLSLRKELDQDEPSHPYDLQQELIDLRLRKRYLQLLSRYPHQLTSRSTLDEIRQTYEQLTASFCAQARDKLKRLWDQLDVPSNQRIIPKTNDNHDDYLAITDEIKKLETYIESIKPILIKIQKREWYKKEMVDFEKRAADPARLRGSSTQLLREERFRKDLSREFPKLTDDLYKMVTNWEESTGQNLIYGGESYLDTMDKEKLSVDFELLHLRLLTKCQLLTQTMNDENHQPSRPSTPLSEKSQSPSSTPLSHKTRSPSPKPLTINSTIRSPSLPRSSLQTTATTRSPSLTRTVLQQTTRSPSLTRSTLNNTRSPSLPRPSTQTNSSTTKNRLPPTHLSNTKK